MATQAVMESCELTSVLLLPFHSLVHETTFSQGTLYVPNGTIILVIFATESEKQKVKSEKA